MVLHVGGFEGDRLQSLLCATLLLIDRGRERERKGMEKGKESAEAHISFRIGKILTVRFPMPEKDPNCLVAEFYTDERLENKCTLCAEGFGFF